MGLVEKLKLLIKARKPLTDIITEIQTVKSGFKTVPFWISVILSLSSLVLALEGLIPPVAALVATTVLTMIYNILRGAIKSQVPGQKPLFQTSEFWMTVLGSVSAAIVGLQAGGINPEWFKVALGAIGIIGGSLGAGQNLAGQQPGQVGEDQKPVEGTK